MSEFRSIETKLSGTIFCATCGFEHGRHALWCLKVLRGLATACQHEWQGHQSWINSSGEHGSKRCALCARYVQW